MEYYSDFQERLNELTEKSGLDALADAVGVTVNAVTQWRRGNNFPSFDKFQRIADFYGVSFDWLAGRSDVREVDEIAQKTSERYGLADTALKRLEFISNTVRATDGEAMIPRSLENLALIQAAVNMLVGSKLGNDVLANIAEYVMRNFDDMPPLVLGGGSIVEFLAKENNGRHLFMIAIQERLAAIRTQYFGDGIEKVREDE